MKSIENIIEFRNVSFSYNKGDFVLKKLNFKIQKGHYVVILGANNSGKSTLSFLINGLFLPCLGEVFACSFSTFNKDKLPLIRKDVGLVFQDPKKQVICHTVFEELAFGLQNLAIPKEQIFSKVNNILAKLNIFNIKDKYVYHLSGGQLQKVILASILVMEPKVIVLDDPFAMLDLKAIKEILEILRFLKRKGITIIHLTSNIGYLVDYLAYFSYIDKLMFLVNGTLDFVCSLPLLYEQILKFLEAGLELPVILEFFYLLRKNGFPLDKLKDEKELIEKLYGYIC